MEALLGTALNNNKDSAVLYSSFIDGGVVIDDPSTIVERFNNFFVNIGARLAKSIQDSSFDYSEYLNSKQDTADSFALYPTDFMEIINIVDALNDKKSCGIDGISVNLIKKMYILDF